MVLKILISFLLFNFAVTSTVHARRANPSFKKAQKQFKQKRYSQSLKSLRRGYNFKKTRRIPAKALFLIALNYHKLKNENKSIYYFNRLIKNKFTRKHIGVLKALKKDEVDEIKVPYLLGSTYFYLAQGHYVKFTKNNSIQDAHKAKQYFQICDDTDFNDKCADFIDNIELKIAYEKKKRKSFEFFLYAGRLIYQEQLTLKESTTNTSHEIIANNSTLCYGAGIRRGNAFSGYELSGCFFSGTATVASAPSSGYDYKQSGVPIAGALVEVGKYYKFDNESTRFGVSLPIIYRSGLYSDASDPDTGESATIEDPRSMNWGIMFTAGVQVSLVELQTKLGHMGDANLLSLNLGLNF
ncbi:MAG: hypothetical protein HON90_06505 [Halobacteriovoraceae bacterium]|jgi:hypothetical protein|nr:hypothetical protein [Halobacteriovoraceae bacterium]